jgi:diguanylate cyclase (GGDEF)-like protein
MRVSTPSGFQPVTRAEEANVTSVEAWTSDTSFVAEAASAAQRARTGASVTADDVARALRNGELEMFFQPKLEITSGEITGAEALLRWRHPVDGVLGPADLLSAADRAGLMPQITRYVLDQALAVSSSWRAAGLVMPVAVNVDPADLADRSLADHVEALLDTHGLLGEMLLLEVTENAVLQNLADTSTSVERLRRIGVRLSIDDFGVGYSSLSRLVQFQLAELKVDMSLIQAMRTSTQATTAVRAVIDLGHALGMRVVAEGVEDERVLISLRSLGCDTVQGYLIAAAMPADDFRAWVVERRTGSAECAAAVVRSPGRRTRWVDRWRQVIHPVGWPAAAVATLLVGLYLCWQVFRWGGPEHQHLIGDLAFVPVNGGAAVAAAMAAWVHRRDRATRRAWLWLGAALSSYLVGDIVQMFYELGLRQDLPFPSGADLGYLAFYPMAFFGLLSLPTPRRSREQRLTAAFDVGTVVLGGSAVIWSVDLGPTVAAGGSDTLALLTSLAYPVGDLVLLFGAVSLLLRVPTAGRPVRLLLLGFGSYLVTDMLYSHIQLTSAYQGGDLVDAGWVLAHAALGLAAVAYARQPMPAAEDPRNARTDRRHTWLPHLAIAIGYVTLIVASRNASWNPLGGLVLVTAALTAVVTVRQWTSLRENSQLLDKYHTLAATDALTGLASRRRLLELAETEFDRAMRGSHPLSVLMIDVDHFKQINDRFGHHTGDQVLCTVAEICRNQLRPQDLIGRYGGDELIAVLPDTDALGAAAVAARLQERLRHLFEHDQLGPALTTLSIGVAELDDTRSLDALLARADTALYNAKDEGRDCTRTYSHA